MWEVEYSKDEYIEELVIASPKSYTYRTSRDHVVCRQKVITVDRANEALVDFSSLKKLVLNSENTKSP